MRKVRPTKKKVSLLIKTVIPVGMAFMLLGSCNEYELSDKQSEVFLKFFGSYQEDIGYDVRQDSDGGYVVVGTWSTTGQRKQICLIKTDEKGNQVDWSPKLFGGANNDFGRGFRILDDGYVIVGTSVDTTTGLSSIIMVRTDKQGNPASGFPKLIDIGSAVKGNDVAWDIEVSEEYGFFIVGSSDSPPLGTEGGSDFILIIVDQNGDRSFLTRSWGAEGNDQIRRIIPVSDGYMVVGSTFFPLGATQSDVAVYKIKTDGTGPVGQNYGTSLNDVGEFIIQESDTEYLIVGTSANAEQTQSSIYLSRFTISGVQYSNEQIDVQSPVSSASYTGKAIRITDEGNYIVAGTETQTDDNMYLLGLDTNGSRMFLKNFGQTGSQSANGFQITSDGGFIIVGSNAFEGNSMISLVKTGPEGSMD